MATAPAAIHAGGSASVGSSGLERPAEEDHGHDDQVEDEPSANAAMQVNARRRWGVGEEQRAEHGDGLGGHGEQEPGAVDAGPEAGFVALEHDGDEGGVDEAAAQRARLNHHRPTRGSTSRG
jgi:hypothetical protein